MVFVGEAEILVEVFLVEEELAEVLAEAEGL